jgi:DnaJ-class molecular chaperone
MTGRECSACVGTGWYFVTPWPDYAKRQCAVCRGSGRMERQADGSWGPAPGAPVIWGAGKA